MTAPVARAAPAASSLRLLSEVPHRFFFLVGVNQIVFVSLWWAWVLAARAWPQIPAPAAATASTAVHALLMICGFAPFFMFGFLFTAGPRWLGVAPPPARDWLPAGIVAAVAALALVPLEVLATAWGDTGVRVAAGAYAVAWLWLWLVFLRLVRTSEATDKVHARLVLVAHVAGIAAVGAFAVQGSPAQGWVRGAGFWGFLLPVFVVVCHRMIPFFTASVVPFVTAFRPGWLLAAMVGAPVAQGLGEALGLHGFVWLVDLPAAALMLWLTFRWGLVQSMRNRLLAMLHLGFVWYGIGFALAGMQSLAVLAGNAGAPLAALHALAIGFAASLLMAMVTRVTCGHSGRTLAADTLTWRLFQLLQATALVRVAAELLAGPLWLAVAAVLWVGAFVPWCFKYAPVYWRPRADGRPG
jgi:uncharacterized protein involved in response to NO